jgi:hypothetical protein
VWFAEPGAGRIGEINPMTHAITEFKTPVESSAIDIVAGPDGNLWFTGGGIGNFNPTTHAITEYAVPYPNSAPWQITAGPDGNIWFTDFNSDPVGAIGVVALDHFVVTQQPPTSVTAGEPFGLTVNAMDSSGKLDSSFNGTVTVALTDHVTGSTLGGTLTVTASNGVATFSDLTLTKADYVYWLKVSSDGVASKITRAIVVTPAAASQLVITQQPSATATAGVVFATQPIVTEKDRYGNVIMSDSSHTVTAARGSKGTASLQGSSLIVTMVKGVVRFSGLYYDKAQAMNIVFTTNATGVTPITSRIVVVSPAAASKLVITQQPSATATVGVAFAVQPIVKEEDEYGNLITSDSTHTVTAARGSLGTGTLQGSNLSVTLVKGVAALSGLYYNKAETMNIVFTTNARGVSKVTSRKVVVGGPGPRPFVAVQPVIGMSTRALDVTTMANRSAFVPAYVTYPPDPLLAPLVLDSPDFWDSLGLRKRPRSI